MEQITSNKQKCKHDHFYTIGNEAYCNDCYEYLGYFNPYKSPFGFVKTTNQMINNKCINQEINRRKTGYYLK